MGRSQTWATGFCHCLDFNKDVATSLWPILDSEVQKINSTPSACLHKTSRCVRETCAVGGFNPASIVSVSHLFHIQDGNFLQDLLIDEGVAAVDALSRAAALRHMVTVQQYNQYIFQGFASTCSPQTAKPDLSSMSLFGMIGDDPWWFLAWDIPDIEVEWSRCFQNLETRVNTMWEHVNTVWNTWFVHVYLVWDVWGAPVTQSPESSGSFGRSRGGSFVRTLRPWSTLKTKSGNDMKWHERTWNKDEEKPFIFEQTQGGVYIVWMFTLLTKIKHGDNDMVFSFWSHRPL